MSFKKIGDAIVIKEPLDYKELKDRKKVKKKSTKGDHKEDK